MTCLTFLEGILRLFSQLTLKFHWVQMCFGIFNIRNYIEINQSVMPKPVWLMTVQEAHKEYSKSGSRSTPSFDAEACELGNLLAHVSQFCQKLNLPTPKELYRPMFFKHWRHFLDQNYTRQAVWFLIFHTLVQVCSRCTTRLLSN